MTLPFSTEAHTGTVFVVDPTPRRYHYDAIITGIHDGDTITVDLDLGRDIWLRDQKLRLYGLNAPEITGKQKLDGAKSRVALVALVSGSVPVPIIEAPPAPARPLPVTDAIAHANSVIETILDVDEKFGRVLARVYVKTLGGWLCVNDEMNRLGYSKPWDGQGAKPV